MFNCKVIIIGAQDNDNNNLNNPNQANHNDLCKLKYDFKNQIDIVCYDPLYKNSFVKDDIVYLSNYFNLNDISALDINKHNIIVEFCNIFDENFVNRKNNNGHLYNFNSYTITVLSCGCEWTESFPLECIKYIIYNNIITPCNPYIIESYLYIIYGIKEIHHNNKYDIMKPYIYGLYQNMGTLKWRGCKSDNYYSENILRELFTLMGYGIFELSENEKKELNEFVSNRKHWNELPLSLRENFCKNIYGIIFS